MPIYIPLTKLKHTYLEHRWIFIVEHCVPRNLSENASDLLISFSDNYISLIVISKHDIKVVFLDSFS
jgi:hypothetical protein